MKRSASLVLVSETLASTGTRPLAGLDGDAGDFELFFKRQRAGLAQRTAGDEAVDAVADLEVDVPGRAFGVDALVGVELGGDGGKDALPAGRCSWMELLWVGETVDRRSLLNILAEYLKYLRKG
jgi:hypothetical protein